MTYFLGLGFESSHNLIQATPLSAQLALKHALTCLWTCKDTKICKYLKFCSCKWQHFKQLHAKFWEIIPQIVG